MKISRRNLLIGTGAAGTGLIMPRKSWAPPPPPPPKRGIYGVHFGGTTKLTCPAANLDFPYSSSFLFVHCKYRASATPGGGNVVSLDTGTGAATVGITFNGSPKKGKVGIYGLVRSTTVGSIAKQAPTGSVPWDTNWHDLKMTVDSMSGVMDMTIDDADIPGLVYLQGSTNGFDVGLSEVITQDPNHIHLPLTWSQGTAYIGDFQDLFIAAPAAYADIRSAAVKGAFRDPSTGTPIYLPDDGGGVLPSGDDAGILLHGPTSYYPRNLAKTEFTWPAGQSTPGAFTLSGPALTTSTTDAWGFTGV